MKKAEYDHIRETRLSFRHVDYVLTTRQPVDGLYDFILDHKEHIENINVNFEKSERSVYDAGDSQRPCRYNPDDLI